jgi:hypothetical protein
MNIITNGHGIVNVRNYDDMLSNRCNMRIMISLLKRFSDSKNIVESASTVVTMVMCKACFCMRGLHCISGKKIHFCLYRIRVGA